MVNIYLFIYLFICKGIYLFVLFWIVKWVGLYHFGFYFQLYFLHRVVYLWLKNCKFIKWNCGTFIPFTSLLLLLFLICRNTEVKHIKRRPWNTATIIIKRQNKTQQTKNKTKHKLVGVELVSLLVKFCLFVFCFFF